MRSRRQFLSALGATAALGQSVPRPAPDFTVTLPDGRPARVADFKGKVLVFSFISTS